MKLKLLETTNLNSSEKSLCYFNTHLTKDTKIHSQVNIFAISPVPSVSKLFYTASISQYFQIMKPKTPTPSRTEKSSKIRISQVSDILPALAKKKTTPTLKKGNDARDYSSKEL